MALGRNDLRTAVIGVGHFGQYHLDKYAHLPGARPVAVVDIDNGRGASVARRHGIPSFTDYRQLEGLVDAVSIATPTVTHFEIAKFFLDRGVHVLVEKPITTRLADADELIALAESQETVLQVGHQERLFAAQLDLPALTAGPDTIICRRTAPPTGRSLDCNVVLDLMIHDIDIAQSLLGTEIEGLSASGISIYSGSEDEAEARVDFVGGCEVHLYASRSAERAERTVRIGQSDGNVDVDFLNRTCRHARHGDIRTTARHDLTGEINGFPHSDVVALEVGAFLHSIRTGRRPLVSGQDGRNALALALMVNDAMSAAALEAAETRVAS